MRVEITRRAKKDLLRFDPKTCSRLLEALTGLQEEPPGGDVKKLKGVGPDHWRLRVGDLRVIFRVDPAAETVFVLHIGHRREVYR